MLHADEIYRLFQNLQPEEQRRVRSLIMTTPDNTSDAESLAEDYLTGHRSFVEAAGRMRRSVTLVVQHHDHVNLLPDPDPQRVPADWLAQLNALAPDDAAPFSVEFEEG